MLKLRQIALAALLAVGVAAPAVAEQQVAASKGTPCPFVRQIYNFKDVDDRTAIFWTSPRRAYKVTFFNSCRELKWAIFARVEARPGICLSRGDRIVVGRHGFREHCIVDRIEALPPKGEAAPAAY
jgi:hypothetical protein